MQLKSIKFVLPILLLGSQTVFGQLAATKGITREELFKHLNGLFQQNTDAAKNNILKEALFLSKSKKEEDQLLSAQLYEGLEQTDMAETIKKGINKKFPKGITVRNTAFGALFQNTDLTAQQAEDQYKQLLQQYPEGNYEEKSNGVYGYATGAIALQYAREKNLAKVTQYMNALKPRKNYVESNFMVERELNKQGEFVFVQAMLEPVYTDLTVRKNSAESTSNKDGLPYYGGITLQYAESLMGANALDKALDVLALQQQQLPSEFTTILYAKALNIKGRHLDAFSLLENEVVQNGKTTRLMNALLPLYSQLNGNLSDTTQYIGQLDGRIKSALITKLKSEMIKNEAPQFSLMDNNGKEVSLASLKGKVVVLDFWATWCGPCKISFPGMQAAVNKYANDDEVTFLFVNTWQKEINYKDLVAQFIAENKYSFHVLFDEMKDQKKSVVSAYGVKGIPNKVVIDKEGFIRFQSAGSDADIEKIVNEISVKIDLAKKG
ncbi:TlpA family protein disulfide reductase [Sphingobacterium sp. G1-14]|nr:TlpA disulfide reductase family protein [Sphingobacterium sp. G1-14]